MPDSAIQEVVCCIGQPVAGNPTQFMMQRALAAAGLDWCCLTLEVSPEDLEDAIRGIRAFGFKGANLTIPHKVAVAAYLDALTESAQLMGAVNCIHWVGNQLIGENTDGRGFVQSLRDVREVAQKKVVLLGAGGTARAIAVELGRAGVAEIQVANRTSENAQKLVDVLRDRLAVQAQVLPWNGPLSIPDGTDLLINATAMGLLDLDARIPLKLETLDAHFAGRRCGVQSTKHVAAERSRTAWLHDCQWVGHVSQSSRAGFQNLDRLGPRSRSDARSGRGIPRDLRRQSTRGRVVLPPVDVLTCRAK